MKNQETDALRLVPDEEQIFAWLNRKYVQRAEERQRSMNLQYMEAETHDLSASLHRWLLAAAPASPLPGGGWQDISTAPKDEVILLYGLLDPHPTERHLHTRLDEPKRFTGYWDEIDDAWCPVGSTWEGPWIEPTHWIPLPAAPTGEPK